jgi:hypothetical protein
LETLLTIVHNETSRLQWEAGMTDDMRASAAYKALSRVGKRVFDLIAAEIRRQGGGEVAISFNDFAARCSLKRISVRYAVKQIVATGLVQIGFGRRRISIFKLAPGWRALDTDEATRLVRQAHEVKLPRPQRVAAPRAPKAPKVAEKPLVETRTRQQPSLPKLSCLQGDP